MKFGFVSCVQLGLSCMQAIYRVGGALNLILTLEDGIARSKAGRIYVDSFAHEHDIPVRKIRNINDVGAISALRDADLDWLFIVGWSQIAREEVLSIPRKGAIGMHPTLLPVGRGRAAIPWAILKELDQTGVSMYKMDTGVDTGPLLAQQEIPMPANCNATTLYRLVEDAHVTLIEQAYPKLARNQIKARPQDDRLASEWPGRKPEDGRIDRSGSVREAERLVRAVTHPYPGAFVEWHGRKMIVWQARIMQPNEITDRPALRFPDGTLECLRYEYVPGVQMPAD